MTAADVECLREMKEKQIEAQDAEEDEKRKCRKKMKNANRQGKKSRDEEKKAKLRGVKRIKENRGAVGRWNGKDREG